MNMSNDFIGTGWALPLGTNPRGGIAVLSGTDEIDAAIRMIIETMPGERVMRPEFGCAIWDLLFSPVDANTLGLMEQSVSQALDRWEPRIEVDECVARPDPDESSCVLLEIAYRLRATNDRRNLVYPFYVIPREHSP
jgi:phage baseplate assembly protein W